MEYFEDIDLIECPCCGGAGILEEEGGWCVYVQCLDCGAHTTEVPYKNEAERREAAQLAARNWSFGKVIRPGPGD